MKIMEDKEAIGDSKVEEKWKSGQGGFRATIFVHVVVALNHMGFVVIMYTMVLYFLFVMHFDGCNAANTQTNFLGTSFLLSVVGGFISDAYLTRLNTCLMSLVFEVLGLMIITYQAYTPKLHPKPCGKSHCIRGGQAVLLYTSLGLYAFGTGGVRGSAPTLGADQFSSKDPKESTALASYFNWLLLSLTIGASLGLTVIVNIGKDGGWALRFFICMLASSFGFVVVAIGKPFYRVRPPGSSPITTIVQVIVVAFRNRNLTLPEETDELYEINDKGAFQDHEKISITHQFRCLEKAAILPKDASAPKAWGVCTVTQVEEVKILTRMVPIIASTIIMNTCLAQLQTFSLQQGVAMNLYLGNFKVPAPSVPVIPLVFMFILIPIYEYVFIPLARKITHYPSGITHLQRVGVGLVLSAVSMAIAGVIEVKRRNQDLKHHTKISVFWLSFQYGIFGIADMFTLVGLMDFFYTEAPSGMKSLSTSFTFLSQAIGYYISSILVVIINSVTSKVKRNKRGWLDGQTLNEFRLEYFYWFLTILSCLNFVLYLFLASWYKYKTDESGFQMKDEASSVKSAFQKEERIEVVEEEPTSTSCSKVD